MPHCEKDIQTVIGGSASRQCLCPSPQAWVCAHQRTISGIACPCECHKEQGPARIRPDASGNNVRTLPPNTVNIILTEAHRANERIEAEARQKIDDLGVRWEREIRELQAEVARLRKATGVDG